MSPRSSRWHAALGLGLTCFLGPLASAPAAAVDDADTETAPAISLRLSPAVLEIPYEAGASEHQLRVDNTGSQSLQVVAQAVEFSVTEDGITEFAGPEELGAASWVELETDTFEITPGDRREVGVTVEVPADAEPGERYVSIVFAVPAPEAGPDGNIPLTHRVAAKLYLGVPGEPVHHLELGELNAPWLVDSGAAHLELTVHNRGNVHRRFEAPEPLLATSGSAQFPFENFTVLGDSTRVVEAVWADPPTICWCQVEVAIDDGRGGISTASTRVLVFPLRATLALLAVVAGLSMWLAGRRRRRADRLNEQLERARQEGFQAAQSTTGAVQTGTPARTRPRRSELRGRRKRSQ